MRRTTAKVDASDLFLPLLPKGILTHLISSFCLAVVIDKLSVWIDEVDDDGMIYDVVVVIVPWTGTIIDPVGFACLKTATIIMKNCKMCVWHIFNFNMSKVNRSNSIGRIKNDAL